MSLNILYTISCLQFLNKTSLEELFSIKYKKYSTRIDLIKYPQRVQIQICIDQRKWKPVFLCFKHVYYNRYNSHLTSFYFFFPLPQPCWHVRWAVSIEFEKGMYFQHTCPAVLPVHSYRVQMEIHFNNLYKQVGYAQSLQF